MSSILMVAGLGWVGYLLITAVDDPRRFIPDSMAWLIVATGLVALSLATNIWLFSLFLHAGPGQRYPFGLVARLSVAGQLLRYLPGRFWGLAYQINVAGQRIPALYLTRANIDLMVFSLLGSTLVAFVLVGKQQGWSWEILVALSVGGIALVGGLFLGGANWLIKIFASRLPGKARKILTELAMAQPTASRLTLIFTIFLGSWVLYLSGWNLLGLVFHSFSKVDFTSLCAFYTLASVIGIVSALTPAGLGVREAAFLVLAASSATHEVVAFFAVFGRIWLMLIDVALLMAVMSFFSITKDAS
ncbi:MAG: hypothetical protein RKO66_19695 [Candidatus Contendobacter sp.]|nr:hypothetical protein [Candidatus Contendobacter sp.]MDS4056981.1 hypothetical protein [Candidatus Contendobacter sp.]